MKTIQHIIQIFISCGLILFSVNAFGQISQGGIPYSFQISSDETISNERKDIFLREIPTIEMPAISRTTIDELKANNKQQIPYQFAYSFDVNIDLKQSALKDSLDCGFLYRLALKSSDAYSINVIFSEYRIPPGAKLFMYNEKQDYVIGAYTSNNNKEDGIFAVSPVVGEKIILEYFEPYFSDFSGSLVIGRVSHDFLDILNSGGKSELRAAASCEKDVNCSEGNNWQKEKRAVCRMVINGSKFCSGALINNTNNDGRAYFLTAHHCLSNQSDASKTIFYFNYEKPPGPPCGLGNGSLSQSISGATLRATNSGSDFTLLELSKIPISTFRPYFAGWERHDSQGSGGVGIHHPVGDVKKISTHIVTPIQAVSYPTGMYPAECWRINWDSGVTEPGSSGSPLFNLIGRIIGQLYAGASFCNNMAGFDYYGRFNVSWNNGNSSSNRLFDWLNPNNNTLVLNGIDACPTETVVNLNLNNTISSGSHIYQASNKIESTSVIQSGATVEYEAGSSIVLKSGFKAEAGSNFKASINQNLQNCVIVPDPINLVAWTTVACIGSGLQFNITNATNYTVKINTILGQLIYNGSGSISGNSVTVWSASGASAGNYIATITFSSAGEEISNTYTIVVKSCLKDASVFAEENTEELTTIQETYNNKIDFTVFPNPNGGNFTIELLNAEEMKPYSVQVFNSNSALISKIEHCNTNQLNFNHAGLPAGIYYVKLSMGINIVTKKVIIQ